jgi:hypothetical protein
MMVLIRSGPFARSFLLGDPPTHIPRFAGVVASTDVEPLIKR